jgi:hypothetical protein
MESPGAILRVEVRGTGSSAPPSDPEALSLVRSVLEASAPEGLWSPVPGDAVSLTCVLENPAEALPLLHRLRTELCSDPKRPRVHLAAGLARGKGPEASRFASQALSSLPRKKRRLTRCHTGDKDADAVLEALCRTLDALLTDWTRAQWQAIHRRDRGSTLQQIGHELGIANQNVSKRLIAARYLLYQDVLAAASLVFSKAPPSR